MNEVGYEKDRRIRLLRGMRLLWYQLSLQLHCVQF